MLEFQNVSFSYAQAEKEGTVRNINLTIQPGEAVLLCGESGCGKTTLTRLINSLIPHYDEGELSGRVLLNGQEVGQMTLHELAEQVGSVFQNPRSQFFTTDTTSELAFGPENLGMQKEKIMRRIQQVWPAVKQVLYIDKGKIKDSYQLDKDGVQKVLSFFAELQK